jgi:hypothetical protein
MDGMRFSRDRSLRLLPVAALLLAFASPAHAQFWKKKDYHHWSARDCQKLLTNSPWVKDRTFSTVQMPNGMQDSQAAAAPQGVPSAGQAATPGRQAMTEIKYTAEFFSALPVRQAMVRLNQIRSHYDKMTPAQKKAFDASAARFLSVKFPKYTVIRVTYSTNVGYWQQALNTLWQFQTTPNLRNSAYLIVDGKTVPLVRYQWTSAKEQAFFLFFPRRAKNEPVLNLTNKSLTLQVTNSVIQFTNAPGEGNLTASPPPSGNVQMEFKVKKMKFHGKVAY